MNPCTLVLGLGSPLMADDAAGIEVIELLRQKAVPPEVTVRDGGTGGWGLVAEMDEYQRVILVDSARMGARPGDWRRFTLDEVSLLSKDQPSLSLHGPGLDGALQLAEALGVMPPELVIYGIEPAEVGWDRPMSGEVRTALPTVAEAVLAEVTGKATYSG